MDQDAVAQRHVNKIVQSSYQPVTPRWGGDDEGSVNMRLELLGDTFGHQSFVGDQEMIIKSVLNRRDTVAILPTGGGKSLCYQFPGAALPGVTIIVSPLKALMEHHMSFLNSINMPATLLGSAQALASAKFKVMAGCYKFVFVTPETFMTISPILRIMAFKGMVSLVSVDEAHCIVSWGRAFRTDYDALGHVKEWLPGVPVLALTATA